MLPKLTWPRIPGCLALGEWSHHCGHLGHEDLFCIVLLCILARLVDASLQFLPLGTALAVQWWRLLTSKAGVEVSIFGVEVKIPHATRCVAPKIVSAQIGFLFPVCTYLWSHRIRGPCTAVWLHYNLTSPVNQLFGGSSPWGGCPFHWSFPKRREKYWKSTSRYSP